MPTSLFLDHIVISVSNLKKSTQFYSSFLGKANTSVHDSYFSLGEVKIFLTHPYKQKPRSFDKHNLGLNHIAFGVNSIRSLRAYEKKLRNAKISNSGIQIDSYSKKEFIWFNDPDNIRLELYLRNS